MRHWIPKVAAVAQTCSVSSLRGDGERKRSVRSTAYDAAVGGDQGEASRTGCVAGSGQRWWCRQREKLLVLNTGGVGRAVSCTVAQIVAANVSATHSSKAAAASPVCVGGVVLTR